MSRNVGRRHRGTGVIAAQASSRRRQVMTGGGWESRAASVSPTCPGPARRLVERVKSGRAAVLPGSHRAAPVHTKCNELEPRVVTSWSPEL